MELQNNYSSYASAAWQANTKRRNSENTQRNGRKAVNPRNTAEYVMGLAKLVPKSCRILIGNVCSSAKSGKSLTVNPQLLEKMQNDPEKARDMEDMIKGVESMSKLAEGIAKATGWTIVYQHSYIDENGKYHCRMQTRNDGMLKLSDKLREERKKNSEKLLERAKEKAAEKKEKLEETLEEKQAAEAEEVTAEKTEGGSAYNKAEQLINEKMAASKDGTIYLSDADMKTIIEASQEEDAGKTTVKDQPQVGANLDLKI